MSPKGKPSASLVPHSLMISWLVSTWSRAFGADGLVSSTMGLTLILRFSFSQPNMTERAE